MAIARVVEAAPAVMAAIDGGLVWVGDGRCCGGVFG